MSTQLSSVIIARTGEVPGFPRRSRVPSGSQTTRAVTLVRKGPADPSPPANATQSSCSAKPRA